MIDGTDSHGSNPANLLAWLKAQEAAGIPTCVLDCSNASCNMYGRFNFDNSAWDDVTRILEKLNTILGKNGQKVTFGTVSIHEDSVDWTWGRDFECSFEITVG